MSGEKESPVINSDSIGRDWRESLPANPKKVRLPSIPLARPAILLGCLCVWLSATAVRAGTLAGTVLDPSGSLVPEAHLTLLKSLVIV